MLQVRKKKAFPENRKRKRVFNLVESGRLPLGITSNSASIDPISEKVIISQYTRNIPVFCSLDVLRYLTHQRKQRARTKNKKVFLRT